MAGLSPLERIVYFEILRVYPGFVSQFPDPISRIFHVIFIPAVVWIIFLHFALFPFRKYGKGLVGLIGIGLTVFGVMNGFYGPWAQFAQTWMFLLLAISVFLFMLETFISRKALETVVSNAGKAFGSSGHLLRRKYSRIVGRINKVKGQIDGIDTRLQSISNQIGNIQSHISAIMTQLTFTNDPAQRRHLEAQMRSLNAELERLRREYDNLAKQREKLLAKYQEEVGKKDALEVANPDKFE